MIGCSGDEEATSRFSIPAAAYDPPGLEFNGSAGPESGSMAPCRRSNCGRFCENAEHGNTMSQPTSCAFCFRSPCTWERNPMIDVPFFSLFFSFGMSVKGLALVLFRSKMIRDG